MPKKIILSLGALLVVALLWYLFLKPNDYLVIFKSKALPGTINQTIKLWADGFENSKLLHQVNLKNFSHQLQFNDSIHTYEWNIEPLNDSISQVKVLTTDSINSLSNRIAIPFSETSLEKRTISTVKGLMETLKEHTKSFKVTVTGIDEIPAKYCAYIPLKSKQRQKAFKMMQNYPFLNSVLSQNNLKLNGRPFIQVEDWDMKTDSISYNFCYPIIKPDTLPEIKGIKYKQIEGQKALKTIFNGNYIISDRAWYTMINYAKKNNLNIKKKPFEVFHTNPNMGGNGLNWKAEIYMPLNE